MFRRLCFPQPRRRFPLPVLLCLHLVPYFSASEQTSPRNFAKSQPEGAPSPLFPPKKTHTIRAFRDSRRTFSLPPPQQGLNETACGAAATCSGSISDPLFPHRPHSPFPKAAPSPLSLARSFSFRRSGADQEQDECVVFPCNFLPLVSKFSPSLKPCPEAPTRPVFRLSTDLSPHPRSRFFQLLSRKAAAPFGQIHPVSSLQNQARADAHAAFLTKQTAARLPPGRLAWSLTGRRGFTGEKKEWRTAIH